MLMTKVNSMIYELGSYDEAVNNPIYGQHQRETFEEKLQNLENHQTWEYKGLSPKKKTIGLK